MPTGYVEIAEIKLTRREVHALHNSFLGNILDSFDEQALERVRKKTAKLPYDVVYGEQGLYLEMKMPYDENSLWKKITIHILQNMERLYYQL